MDLKFKNEFSYASTVERDKNLSETNDTFELVIIFLVNTSTYYDKDNQPSLAKYAWICVI